MEYDGCQVRKLRQFKDFLCLVILGNSKALLTASKRNDQNESFIEKINFFE